MSTTTGAERGNIFVDVDPEPTYARSRSRRPRRPWRDALRPQGTRPVTPPQAASATRALRRGSSVLVNADVRTGPFTSWHDTHGIRCSERQACSSGQIQRRTGRRRGSATRRGLVVATSILTTGLVLLAPFVYLASRLVASPSVRIPRSARITSTITSPSPHRKPLRSTHRFFALARNGRPRSERHLRHVVASHIRSAHVHASHIPSHALPAHADAPRSYAPVPMTHEPSPPVRAMPAPSGGASSHAGTSSGTAINHGGPSGVEPFGPGYPGSPNE